ncbi:MAG: hypothetical protein QW165_04200 [Candidatus Woesearchaeota archaeon]
MKQIKRCLAAIVLAVAGTQTGCPAPQRQADQEETLRNYETYNRFDSLYQKQNYMPPSTRYGK